MKRVRAKYGTGHHQTRLLSANQIVVPLWPLRALARQKLDRNGSFGKGPPPEVILVGLTVASASFATRSLGDSGTVAGGYLTGGVPSM